jgi:type I restriction enzyme M protein
MRLTQQQLEAHLWGAANILRGKTAGQAYKNYILSLIFGSHRFNIPDGSRWGDVIAASTNLSEVLTKAMRAAQHCEREPKLFSAGPMLRSNLWK